MIKSNHILIVDDDSEIRNLLSRFLVRHGFRVITAADGREMKKALSDWAIELIVLDLMLPGDDGLTLCRDLRARSDIPVIMLTAMGEELDRIIGLEIGADDYLAKPFNPRELLARIKAVLRRGAPANINDDSDPEGLVLGFEGWVFNVDKRELTSPDGLRVSMSGGEFKLLKAFATHPNRVLNRDQLLDMARGREAQPFDRSIDVQVSRLRATLGDDPRKAVLIKTARGDGYIFTAQVKRL